MSDRGKKKNSGGDAFTVRYRDFEKFLIKVNKNSNQRLTLYRKRKKESGSLVKCSILLINRSLF